ncbi:hypothetical protein EJB05_40079, partial [Eragrostis curvula]
MQARWIPADGGCGYGLRERQTSPWAGQDDDRVNDKAPPLRPHRSSPSLPATPLSPLHFPLRGRASRIRTARFRRSSSIGFRRSRSVVPSARVPAIEEAGSEMSLQPSERAELRRSGFKASACAGEAGRLRREHITVEIRKASRNNALLKRRRAAAGAEAASHAPVAHERMVGSSLGLEALPLLAQGLYSDDSSTRLEAARELRKLLSIENPPIQEVISTGVLPCFVELLDREDCPELQFEAVCALTNIILGTSENVKVVVDHNALAIFAVWALGKVAGISPLFRDIVLAHGALFPLLQRLNRCTKLSILRKATWALGNFCRVLSTANFEHVKPALPMLQRLIHSQDEEILNDACWALFYLSSDNDENIQAVIESGVCPRHVQLLTHSSPSVLIAALHVIGNIARGNYVHIQCIMDHQALPYLLNLLTTNQSKCIKGEVCWIISDIMAGNKDHIQAVISENIIGPLVQLMQTAEFDVKKKAACAISNATTGGTHDQIKYLISQGCIMAFCNLLGYADTCVLIVCLKGIENILKVGEAEEHSELYGVNMYAQMIDDADGLEKIENLQTHDNNAISETAVRLLMSYWLEGDYDVPCVDPFLPGLEEALPFGFDFALPGAFDSG